MSLFLFVLRRERRRQCLVIFRRRGFLEYGHLPGGIKETSGRRYDEVLLYRPLAAPAP